MHHFRQFGVLVLLLVTCLAPAMACMVPNAQMNAEERACCRMMKDQCGQMGMAASHGCCQKTPPSVHDNALNTKVADLHPIAMVAVRLIASELPDPMAVVTGSLEQPDYSPPTSPPSAVAVLRI